MLRLKFTNKAFAVKATIDFYNFMKKAALLDTCDFADGIIKNL